MSEQQYPATPEGDYRRAADEIRQLLDASDPNSNTGWRRGLARDLADMAIRWTAAQRGAAAAPDDPTDSDERE